MRLLNHWAASYWQLLALPHVLVEDASMCFTLLTASDPLRQATSNGRSQVWLNACRTTDDSAACATLMYHLHYRITTPEHTAYNPLRGPLLHIPACGTIAPRHLLAWPAACRGPTTHLPHHSCSGAGEAALSAVGPLPAGPRRKSIKLQSCAESSPRCALCQDHIL